MGLMIGVGAICVTGTSLRGATGAAGSRGAGVGGGMGLAIGADVTGVTEISLRGTTGVVGSRGAGGVTTGVGGRGGTKVGVGPTSVCVTGVDDIRGLTGASAFPTGGAIRSGGVTVVGNLAGDGDALGGCVRSPKGPAISAGTLTVFCAELRDNRPGLNRESTAFNGSTTGSESYSSPT